MSQKEIFFFRKDLGKDSAESSSAGSDQNLIFRFVITSCFILQSFVNYSLTAGFHSLAAACKDQWDCVQLRGQRVFTLLIKVIPDLKVSYVQKRTQARAHSGAGCCGSTALVTVRDEKIFSSPSLCSFLRARQTCRV